MMYRINFLFVFLLILGMVGCKPVRKAAIQPRQVKHEKTGTVSFRSNTSELIDAKKYELVENYQEAYDRYVQYNQNYPEDPAGMYELARMMLARKQISEALVLMEKAVAADPANKWYKLLLAEIYQSRNDVPGAIRIYSRLVKEDPDNLDYYNQLVNLYIYSGKFTEAINALNQLETSLGVMEEISVQKSRLYEQLNKKEEAEKELQNLVDKNPGETRYLLILAEFYMKNEQPDKALEMYNKVLTLEPDNPTIHISLADYYRKAGDKERSYQELKQGFENPNLDIDTKINILLSYYTITEIYTELKDQAFELVNVLVKVHPKDPKVYAINADFLVREKKYSEARENLRKSIALDSSRYVVWETELQMSMQLEDYSSLKEESARCIELFPEQPLPYLFSGLAYFQLKENEPAISAFKKGAAIVVDNDDLKSQFFMYLGDAYHALQKPEDSDSAYQRSLDLKQDNPYVLNNYSYYLSVRNIRLEEAEKMSKKALELDSLNSSFQDTYGWIMYKLGKYQEAEKWISKALEKEGESSAEVIEHYGDVLFKLGENDKAVTYWEKAQSVGKGSSLLEKKIKDKTLYE